MAHDPAHKIFDPWAKDSQARNCKLYTAKTAETCNYCWRKSACYSFLKGDEIIKKLQNNF
jgi:hypothetical protein